jgi:hypothetical protein
MRLMMQNCFILDIKCFLNYESLRRIVLSGETQTYQNHPFNYLIYQNFAVNMKRR